MLYFNYNGRLGDIIFSLWYIKELCQKLSDKANYHLQTNGKIANPTWIEKTHLNSNVYLSTNQAQFIKPLLQTCQFINEVTIGDNVPKGANNFDALKTKNLNTFGGEMRDYCYNFFYQNFTLPREYWKPVLNVKANQKYKDKILFTLTERYVNALIDYKSLAPFKDELVFLGTEHQFIKFNQTYFQLAERIQPSTALEAAELIKGARGFVANQTGFFAIAEALKVPRILLPCDVIKVGQKFTFGPKNVLPLGGWCQNVSINNKLIPTFIQLLSL